MTHNIRILYEMASLAEASYADFSDPGLTTEQALLSEDFTTTQATQLTNNWTVLTHQPNTSSGYSATLFQSTNSNIDADYVLAFRGTEPIRPDLIDADILNLVTDGATHQQIIDLYNDWQRINAGNRNTYLGARAETLFTETAALAAERLLIPGVGVIGPVEAALRARNDVIIDDPTGIVFTIETGILSTELFTGNEADRARGNITIPDGANITVAGHSLGGHLAVAFTRLFSGEIANAYTFNGAGYPTENLPGIGGNAESNIRNLLLAA